MSRFGHIRFSIPRDSELPFIMLIILNHSIFFEYFSMKKIRFGRMLENYLEDREFQTCNDHDP